MTTALITGASGGIGKEFAQQLAARQTNLVLVARSENKLKDLAQQLQEKFKIQVDVIVQDLSEIGAAETVFNAVQSRGLIIDMLINNAGFGDYGQFAERDGKKQSQMIQLNILTLVEMTHKFLPAMRQRRSGSIINLASIAAFQPMPYLSVYAATKAFVLSFSEALWAENKPYGVDVLTVCPGPTETKFFEEAEFPDKLQAATSKLTTSEEVVKEALKALEQKQATVVTGGLGNQIIVNASRFLPRETLVNLISKQFKS